MADQRVAVLARPLLYPDLGLRVRRIAGRCQGVCDKEPSGKDVLEAIKDHVPDCIMDLRYATDDNFTGRVLYAGASQDSVHGRLRRGTLKKLKSAAEQLKRKGYRLVIWDAYRPLEAQRIMWEAYPDERFVAHPDVGSKHNRGCAVDVTLADENGYVLEMPSGFDDFSSDRAKRLMSSEDLADHERTIMQRLIDLQIAMGFAGFEIYEDEWWHFTDSDWECYAIE